ncbi:MAG: phospholipase D-like domain-containing protein [Dehalococcoidia bacterium]
MIERFSSRRQRLGGFLDDRLRGARAYDRIAGYFNSSILEIAGEALETLAPGAVVRVVCNSELDPLDVQTAKAAKQAQFRAWCAGMPEDVSPALRARLERLYGLLRDGRLQVRVLPDSSFGLVHAKAGVITAADGDLLAFIGSTNESRRAWTLNYEFVWTDDSAEGIAWVQEEFDALWFSEDAVELADAVVRDIERYTRRVLIPSVREWREGYDPNPAAPVVELPVYRKEGGLWAHQKAFVKKAFDAHRQSGARFVLADQVGLGKTVQLGLAAKLMALHGGGPVLALVPKPLLQQWQDELWNLLALPSARWTGRQWIDEQGVVHAPGASATDALLKCPRRFGIVSTGLLLRQGDVSRALAGRKWECVILDEAHRARRRNLGPAAKHERPEPNNLLRFLNQVARSTKSLLLATATPVQLDPIEAWDLLAALGAGHDEVLGSSFSRWRA